MGVDGKSLDIEVLDDADEHLERRNRVATGFARLIGGEDANYEPTMLKKSPPIPDTWAERLHRIMFGKAVNNFILFCILMSIITMAMASPVKEYEYENDPEQYAMYEDEMTFLSVSEWTLSIIFTIEAGLKIIAMEGFSPYWRNPWNKVDFTIVVIGWATDILALAEMDGLPKMTPLRAFRSFRVLRAMKFIPGMVDIVDTFFGTMLMVLQGLAVIFYFVAAFSVLGMELWGDGFDYRCAVLKPTSYFPPNATIAELPLQTSIPTSTCVPEGVLGNTFSSTEGACVLPWNT